METKNFEQIIVHIGPPKTGTTHLQTTLAANAELLLAHGVFYPLPRAGLNGHHALVRKLFDPADSALENKFYGELGDDDLILGALTEQTDARVAVLSSEAFLRSFALNAEKMHVLDDLFCSLATSVRYVAYLRDPVKLYASFCSQKLSGDADFPRRNWGYSEHLINLHAELGPRLEVRPYDRASFVGGDILTDFLGAVLGSDIGVQDLKLEKTLSNPSLSSEGMFLVQCTAMLRQMANPNNYPRHDDLMRKMAIFIRRIDTETENYRAPQLRPHIAAFIMADAAEGLAKLRDLFGVELPQNSAYKLDSAAALPDKPNAGLMLVRDVFEVDPDRTALLADKIQNHPRCPEGLADLLQRILMPSTT